MNRADKPGTERHRDEARSDGGPRMHGKEWHDDDGPRDLERVADQDTEEAPAEAAQEEVGMGKHIGRGEKGAARVDEASPRGKGTPGIKEETGLTAEAKGTKREGE